VIPAPGLAEPRPQGRGGSLRRQRVRDEVDRDPGTRGDREESLERGAGEPIAPHHDQVADLQGGQPGGPEGAVEVRVR